MKRLLCALVLCVGAFVARAGDVSGPTDDLEAAIGVRIAQIGTPAPDALQAAEAKKLSKAKAKLALYAGNVDKAGLTSLLAAGKLLVQSKTEDPGVAAAVVTLVDAIATCLGTTDAEIVARLDQIYTLSDRDKALQLLQTGRTAVADAATLAPTNISGALQKLLAAAGSFAKARSHIEKTLARLDAQKLPLFNDPYNVLNLNGKPAVISFIAWDVILTPPVGAPIRVRAKFKDFQDPASGFTLPYKMVDSDSELELYPTFLRALEHDLGSSPIGGRVSGSMRFVSTKHGTVDVPVDLYLYAN